MADNVTAPVSGQKFKTKDTGANGHLPGHILYDTAEAEVLGLVTASPAANTVLGRLKDLLSLIVLATGTNIIGKVGIDQTTPGTTNGVSAVGNVAHDGADSGDPVKVGAKAITALSGATLVASADRTDAQSDLDGAIITRPHGTLTDLVSGNASNTDGTSTSVIGSSGAGIKTYLTDVTITNTSATNIYVEMKDGTTVKWTFPVPANSGVTHHFASPLGGTANTAWNFDPSAAATTIICSAAGFKSKI